MNINAASPEEESRTLPPNVDGGDTPVPERSANPDRDWRYWMRRLLVCNPFFLASAALLLLGVNRLSTDDRLFTAELPNLLFNFFSLQVYEVLVLVTALVLARRRIWYDSSLLIVMDHGLALVPFMLISQAALEGLRLAAVLILAGAFLVASRVAAVRFWFPRFHLPPRALVFGALILAANIALPLLARPIMEKQVQDWEGPDRWVWLLLLPVLAAGGNFLPRPGPDRFLGHAGERPWLPLFLYGLWIAGTAAHARCIGHICGVAFPLAHLAPLLLVATWTLSGRLTDCIAAPSLRLRNAALLLTVFVPLLAAGQGALFVSLAGANLVAYVGLWWKTSPDSSRRALAGQLAMVTAALLLAGLPTAWLGPVVQNMTRDRAVAGAAALYLILIALTSRRAELALVAAFALAIGLSALRSDISVHLALHIASAFLVGHSLRWQDHAQPGAAVLRWLTVMVWLLNAIVSIPRGSGFDLSAVATGGTVLCLWLMAGWHLGFRRLLLIPAGATGVMTAAPIAWCAHRSSVGLLALGGSFVLLALGAIYASRRTPGRHRVPETTAGKPAP